MAVLCVGVYWRFGHFEILPAMVRPTANVVNHFVQQRLRSDRQAVEVQLLGGEPVIASRLVLIVDESVGASYMSLNGAAVDTTPYLTAIGSRLLNFGMASSGTTCSYGSNLFLNSFVHLADVETREAIEARQTIYYYAKKAGYRTALLSSQNRSAARGEADATSAEAQA